MKSNDDFDDIGSEVSFAGDLSSMPVEDLLGWLASSSNTGRMVLEGDEFTKTLFVKKGMLIAASSTNPREFLSHYLVGWNMVTAEELEHLFTMREEHDTLVGQLLVTLGFISPEHLEDILTFVTYELVYEIFTWDSGSFRFVLGKYPAKSFHPLKVDLLPMILEGVRRRDEIVRLRKLVPTNQHRPRSRLAINPDELTIDTLDVEREFDGSLSIEDLALLNQMSSFTMLERIAAEARAGRVDILHPDERASQAGGDLIARRLMIEEAYGRSQFYAAWKATESLAEDFAEREDVVALTKDLKAKIILAAHARIDIETTTMVMAVPQRSLVEYECTADEAFMLSRLDGRSALGSIIKQIPVDEDLCLIRFIDLAQRGLVKESTVAEPLRRRRFNP